MEIHSHVQAQMDLVAACIKQNPDCTLPLIREDTGLTKSAIRQAIRLLKESPLFLESYTQQGGRYRFAVSPDEALEHAAREAKYCHTRMKNTLTGTLVPATVQWPKNTRLLDRQVVVKKVIKELAASMNGYKNN